MRKRVGETGKGEERENEGGYLENKKEGTDGRGSRRKREKKRGREVIRERTKVGGVRSEKAFHEKINVGTIVMSWLAVVR